MLAPLPLTPTHKNPKGARRSSLPSLLLILAPPERPEHTFTPLTSSPTPSLALCSSLVWGREIEWGGDLPGGASSKPGSGEKGGGAVGLRWLEGWRALRAPSFWLPFAPLVQVDQGAQQYASSGRVPLPDRLERALTMCLQEADKSEGLPVHQSPAA